MRKRTASVIVVFLFSIGMHRVLAQATNSTALTVSPSDNLVAQPMPDETVSYNVSDTGEYKPIIWGLDTAWPSEDNMRRGVAFMGADRVDIVRVSFQPTLPLVDGDLQAEQVDWVNTRLNLVNISGRDTKVVLNCDHPSVDPWYVGNASRWAQLMDVTTKRFQERGRTVVSIAPFNEPDYSATGQGTIDDFYNIAGELRKNARFDNIRISGGNTLNNDQALPWYNHLKDRLDEGNTHQLAGSFDNYAKFYETVRANGHHATNDELHNVMEAMVGVEYGMQTGIWWGTAELARGEFVKASDGQRLGYAENRPNWTAASVYRNLNGKIQAFGGTSERQASTTTYRFVSKERDVYYNGHGPQREYTMVLPGGTGYQQGQTNAETVVNITWGDDIQPVINGKYVLVNRRSGKVMEVAGGSSVAGANLQQGSPAGAKYQQWNVTPVDARIGGDFSYFTFTAVHSGKAPDILNWSHDNGGNIVTWDDTKGSNQQWFLEYAEEGWFYIRSRHSAKCLEVANSSSANGANIQQWQKDGGKNQQWRFLAVGAPVEFEMPLAPSDLTAKSNATSVQLNWSASAEADVAGYTVFRADSANGAYNTLARNVTSTSYVDNTTTMGGAYFYAIKAVDKSLNRSEYSNIVSATVTNEKSLVAKYSFEENTRDSSINLNHSAAFNDMLFVEGKVGEKAIAFGGTDDFLQLPATVANQQEITLATWVYCKGGSTSQRIFDFGNDRNERMYLSPNSFPSKLRFSIKHKGVEQRLDGTALPNNQWVHVAVTLGTTTARLYVNGELEDESDAITIRPMDFKPVLNYIGRSQSSTVMFNGNIDDFRIYNYALSANEVGQLAGIVTSNELGAVYTSSTHLALWPMPANDILHVAYPTSDQTLLSTVTVYNSNGIEVKRITLIDADETPIDVSDLASGVYMVKLYNSNVSLTKKLIIQH